MKTTPCPKCHRILSPSGIVSLDDTTEVPVYQCDECTIMSTVLGVKMETALTFCLDKDGRAVDPADPDQPLL